MAPAATAAPIDITMLNKAHIVQASDVSTHAYPASNVDVRHYHNLYPVMRTLSRDEYYLSTMQRNQHYQSSLEQIQEAAGEQASLQGTSVQHLVDDAYVGACTAKVIGDFEDINAYHRGMMQEAVAAYEEGLASPLRHTVNLLELRQAQQEARSLRIYSDLDIVRSAEEHCHPSIIQASLRKSLSQGKLSRSREASISDDLLD